MKRNYFIVIVGIALFCLFVIFFALWWEIESPIKKEIPFPPPVAPFTSYIAGVGVVEPSSGNIYIGTPVNRLVEKVLVTVGEKVKKRDILFRLEDNDLEANFMVQQAAYKSSLAKLERLKTFPRPEDLAVAEAALKNSKAEWDQAKNEYEMILKLPDPRAISEEEKNRRYFKYQQAEAKLLEAQARWEKIKAGTWKPDLEIARYEVEEAKANTDRVKVEIERTIIRSPIDGTVLQSNIHDGEFPSQDPLKPNMIVGNIDELHLRVSINQLDIPYFQPTAPAVAYFQGDARVKFPLEFIRVEPFLMSKQNITNDITEKIDTRVLKIIYRIKNEDNHLFVGQQMDVFIETKA